MNTENRGILYIVGIGPGGKEHLTVKAIRAIESSQVVVGYTGYIKLLSDMVDGKDVFSTGMTKEVDRCKFAIEMALSGKRVSLVCSGDSGVYAMAGLVLELVSRTYQSFEERAMLEIVPGVPAFVAASALLGAPLMHDFASISLSDRLTSWDMIQKRLIHASEGDFIIVLYNPKSKGRKEHLEKALKVVRQYRSSETPVGVVRNAMREGEEIILTKLSRIPYEKVDMNSLLIIGNSETYRWKDYMITPRGYSKKYEIFK